MLKHSPGSKDKLNRLVKDFKEQEIFDSKSKETFIVSKSSSEGFSSTDNPSSTSTSIEENAPDSTETKTSTPTMIVHPPAPLEEATNKTLSKNDSHKLENYKLEHSNSLSQMEASLSSPASYVVRSKELLDITADPLKVVESTKTSPLPYSLISPEATQETNADNSADKPIAIARPFASSAPNDTTLNNENIEKPSVSRYNTFPQISNNPVPLRHSMMTTATDKSSIAKFNDIDTIKIPDRYQRAELSEGTPRRKSAQSNKGTSYGNKHHHRPSKTTSFINVKRKADALYHIPAASKEKLKLTESDYVKVYDLVTGIRSSVSRCSKAPPKIISEHFTQSTKLIFDRTGNNQAPPTKYEFKFKDYAPEVFRDLRSMFGISQAEYLMSFQDEVGVRPYGSSGKSGSCFYFSNDQKFIVKTVHHAEHLHLRRVLKDYYNHVRANPNTFLCQFYGLHRLKVPTATGSQKIHILVMNNIFPPCKKIHRSYDLKGSTYGRKSHKGATLGKDLNFLEDREFIYMSVEKRNQFRVQLKKDIALLQRLNIMDYSLLVGIHDLSQAVLDEQAFGMPLLSRVDDFHRNSILDSDGGIRATDESGNQMDVIYYMGVIDCLTNYNTMKRLETFFRSLKHDRSEISAIPPSEYGQRFLKFMFAGIKVPKEQPTEEQKNKWGNGINNIKTGIKKVVKQE